MSEETSQTEAEETREGTAEETVEETTAAESETDGQEEPLDELAELQKKNEEANDKFLRLYSEFENFRRRTAKEKLDLMVNAEGEALKTLIPVLDDFERAIANNDDAKDVEVLRDGFKLIYQKLNSILAQKGVKPMEVEAGSEFDTDIHEAITQIPAPEESLKGKVVDCVEKGYYINDKILRHAKVVVGA